MKRTDWALAEFNAHSILMLKSSCHLDCVVLWRLSCGRTHFQAPSVSGRISFSHGCGLMELHSSK